MEVTTFLQKKTNAEILEVIKAGLQVEGMAILEPTLEHLYCG